MRWQGRRESTNVDDRRGSGRGGLVVGGGIGTIVIALLVYFLGGDPSQVVNMQQQTGTEQGQLSPQQEAQQKEAASFTKVVLAETEDVWNKVFRDMGQQYQEPTLVMFTEAVQSACGQASAASGPFIAPQTTRCTSTCLFTTNLKTTSTPPAIWPWPM